MEGLSINNMVTNEDIVITYTPSVANYSYVIIKDNVRNAPVTIYDGTISEIKLTDEGIYVIEVTSDGVTSVSGEYVIDKTAPVISLNEKTYTITTKEDFDINNKVVASDSHDGDLINSITTNYDELDFTIPGIKKLKYSVSDKAGNTVTEVIYVTVKKDNSELIFAGQVSIALLVLVVILTLVKYLRSIKLEKRFSKYTINSSKNKSISLFDNVCNQYNSFVNNLSKVLGKISILKNSSKKYKKYVVPFNLNSNTMNIISNKVIIGVFFIIGYIIISIFRVQVAQPFEMIVPFIFGYYMLDLVYIYRYTLYKKKIEKELIDAITIMNNAFKSGRSIIQAIDLVANELKGPISKEFKKISIEIGLGLDIEVAFRRFASRIKLDEAVYLTSSLSILNKTGGNIIKVFDSIEKTLFSKRRLREEMISLTSSSRMIMYVLICIPVLFATFLSILNPGFFSPLVESGIGILVLILMIIIYVAYIIVVRKVMKVRM